MISCFPSPSPPAKDDTPRRSTRSPPPNQPDSPRTSLCPFSRFFFQKQERGLVPVPPWRLCSQLSSVAEVCWDWAGECAGTGLEIVAGSCWEERWDWAGERTHQEWTRKRARIRVGSVPALGWEAHWEQAGKRAWIGVRKPAAGWEAHWDWAGKGVGSGLGSTLELGSSPRLPGLGWEAHRDQAGKRAWIGLGRVLGMGWGVQQDCQD